MLRRERHCGRISGANNNSLRRPVEFVDMAVLGWIRDNVLTEKMVARTLDQKRQTLTNTFPEARDGGRFSP
jgi:hypothetical protein